MVHSRTSMVVQWIGIRLPVQALVPSLVQKIPHAAEQLSSYVASTKPNASGAHASQQEKPPQ